MCCLDIRTWAGVYDRPTMAEDSPADVRAKASEIVEKIERNEPMSDADTTSLIEAVAADLTAGADQAQHDEERLLKVEAQTHALAEAVIALADTIPAVEVAVKAVKGEM